MSETPFIPFYTSDFLAGTGGMTAATKGVYITLICLIYEAEEPLPQTWDKLARRCGCTLPAFKKAVQDLVDDAKIVVLKSGIWSDKCAKHIALRCERRISAKAAATKRWEKTKENQGKADADAMQTQCKPEPEPEPYPYLRDSVSNDTLVVLPNDATAAIAAYNEAASVSGWPKIQRLSTSRRAALKARMLEAGGLDGWRVALDKATASDFLCARTKQGFLASFDFLTRQSSFAKLMEGNYDNRIANDQAHTGIGSGTAKAFAAVAARMERDGGRLAGE